MILIKTFTNRRLITMVKYDMNPFVELMDQAIDKLKALQQKCNNPLGCACEEANGYPLTDCEYWEEA